jgi:hypothetical protein
MVDTKTLTKYKLILASFMSFLHNCAVRSEYPRDHVHAIEVLAAVSPNDVLRYLNFEDFRDNRTCGRRESYFSTCKFFGNGQKSNLVFHAQSRCVERDKN